MLINKSKFLDCCEYLDKINSCELDELGFEDFFDMDDGRVKKAIKEKKRNSCWEGADCSNKDFILMHKSLWKIDDDE